MLHKRQADFSLFGHIGSQTSISFIFSFLGAVICVCVPHCTPFLLFSCLSLLCFCISSLCVFAPSFSTPISGFRLSEHHCSSVGFWLCIELWWFSKWRKEERLDGVLVCKYRNPVSFDDACRNKKIWRPFQQLPRRRGAVRRRPQNVTSLKDASKDHSMFVIVLAVKYLKMHLRPEIRPPRALEGRASRMRQSEAPVEPWGTCATCGRVHWNIWSWWSLLEDFRIQKRVN